MTDKKPIENNLTDKVENTSLTAYNMKNYMHDKMPEDMKQFALGDKIKTGYKNLDKITSLYQGLYVVGSISSLGKTTFAHQMSDQMAAEGNHVIYFSLEQSALELATKSLARIISCNSAPPHMTSLQIRKNGIDENIKIAMEKYDAIASNVTVVECGFEVTIDDIEQYVKDYIQNNEEKPVVIVDYLQVIGVKDTHMSTKDAVEMHVKRLKQLQKENKLVVIVISSLNRQNYLTQIDLESFKESGGIEYTADVVWGLQLEVLHDEIFNSQSRINEKREKIKEAKMATPRQIELCCLKNRFGQSSYSCKFNYYPQYDYFVAVDEMTGEEIVMQNYWTEEEPLAEKEEFHYVLDELSDLELDMQEG